MTAPPSANFGSPLARVLFDRFTIRFWLLWSFLFFFAWFLVFCCPLDLTLLFVPEILEALALVHLFFASTYVTLSCSRQWVFLVLLLFYSISPPLPPLLALLFRVLWAFCHFANVPDALHLAPSSPTIVAARFLLCCFILFSSLSRLSPSRAGLTRLEVYRRLWVPL